MTTGTLLLRKYLRKTRQRPSHLAAAVGIEKSLICRWVKGAEKRIPGLEHACALERHTRGAVPACSWIKTAKL